MVEKSRLKDASSLAILHYHTLTEGFLSRLGTGFLRSLYTFLIKHEIVLVYIEEGKVIGFVSCSVNTEGMMKRFLLKSPSGIGSILWNLFKNPMLIKSLFETFLAPSKSNNTERSGVQLPQTELLSISVDPKAQKNQIGTQLVETLEETLREKGIKEYKVVAGESLTGANKFYLKNGFVLASKIRIHGNSISNVYVKSI